MGYIWLSIIIFLVIIETMTINLTTIWFVISALCSLVLSFFIDNFFIQFLLFVLLGVILLITTRPILKKFIKLNDEATNIDRVIGMNGVVTEDITKNSYGEVKVDGKRWTAYSDKNIEKDSLVKVLKINGVKIKVEKVEE